MAWFKLSTHPIKHCFCEDWFDRKTVLFWSVLQIDGRPMFPNGVINIDLLRYSNVFFLKTAGSFCSVKLSFKSINNANECPSEVFLWFFQQRDDFLNFQKKANKIDQVRDWISFFRNYGLDSLHECHSQKSYTGWTWFVCITVLFNPAFKALIVLLLHKLLMIYTYLGILTRICLHHLAGFLSSTSPSRVPHMPQTLRLAKLPSDLCIKILLNQNFKNYFKFRLLSAIKLNLKLNFWLDFIHHAPQPKSWACIRWFDWENVFSRSLIQVSGAVKLRKIVLLSNHLDNLHHSSH